MTNGLSDGEVTLLFEGVFDNPSFDCAKGGSNIYSIALMGFHINDLHGHRPSTGIGMDLVDRRTMASRPRRAASGKHGRA